MKIFKVFISSIFIIISFFVWYCFSEQKNNFNKWEEWEQKNYVNIEILKTKIKIDKDEKTIITVNWELLKENSIELK